MDLKQILKDDLKTLEKEKTGLYNRIRSILDDSTFVKRIRDQYPQLPVAPNLRYVDPSWEQVVREPVYFKSTDGHFNNWDFNIRRANLHVLPVIERGKGLIVVDSTRRGKRLPDALTKTVPIWCSVINRALVQKYTIPTFDTALSTPSYAVSPSEHSQIEGRLDAWTNRLLNSTFDIPRLSKPLRPIWITPSVSMLPPLSGELEFFPIICLSASEHVPEGIERRHGYCYVQGSGDDHESWSRGLTPPEFWRNVDQIQRADDEDMPMVVDAIVSEARTAHAFTSWIPIAKVQSRIMLASTPAPKPSDSDIPTIYVADSVPDDPLSTSMLVLQILHGKAGQRQFMEALPRAIRFTARHLNDSSRDSVRIVGESELDAALGIAMVVLAALFDGDGRYTGQSEKHEHTKKSIRTRLEWIQQNFPGANPSRTTMNRINEYFMSPPAMRHWAK
ncbi:hypothetical protein FRC04_003658 [Tulasnella sp. 424]|nr:hypothetical protein FRC04_003658 [Tulasnella sp. 424]